MNNRLMMAVAAMTPATRAVALLPGEGCSYALNGTPADTSTHGIVIKNGKKIIQ